MSRSSVLANPVLVGAVTVLVTVVAVFLAYNANNGLPFVPTTSLKAQVADGSNLVRGNEVRSGGYRIGVIEDMAPVRMKDGTTGAELTLKLDKKAGDVPRDSRVEIRARSALGLKYLDLQLGQSKQNFDDGDTIPVAQSGASTDLDRVLEMFDEPTRDAAQRNLHGFGDALTGRGESLGRTIEELPDFLGHLDSVMANLADPDTELRNFFKELGDAARVVAPVSKTQSRLFTSMADTFAAIGRDEGALKSFIEKSPPTLEVSEDSLRVQRPFLSDLADFSESFRPATAELRAALPTINRAIDKGIGVQRRAVPMSQQLEETLGALRQLSEAPASTGAVRGVTETVNTLNPQLRYYGPFQTVCNYWNYFWYQLAEHISEPDFTGESERVLINTTGRQDDSLGAMGANGPANGEEVQEGEPQHFHGPVYGVAITDKGEADCESGQRGYLDRQARYLDPKYRVHADPRSPGAQGPTWTGRPRVLPGQTFTRIPETGAYSTIPAPEFGDR